MSVPAPMKKHRPRWLRWLRWLGIFVACWVTVVPTLQALWIRDLVLSAVRSAQSVRLEEFRGGEVLSKVELTSQQRAAVRRALPIVPDIGVPGMVTLCFVPHHRGVTRDATGQESAFTICFGCDEARVGRGGIFMTPFLWRSSLRRLFADHHIPVRGLREYSKPVPPNNALERTAAPLGSRTVQVICQRLLQPTDASGGGR